MTDCLEAPQGVVPPEPADPKPGEPITDRHLLAWKLWGNRIAGILAVDRTNWRGERRCILRQRDDGLVR